MLTSITTSRDNSTHAITNLHYCLLYKIKIWIEILDNYIYDNLIFYSYTHYIIKSITPKCNYSNCNTFKINFTWTTSILSSWTQPWSDSKTCQMFTSQKQNTLYAKGSKTSTDPRLDTTEFLKIHLKLCIQWTA